VCHTLLCSSHDPPWVPVDAELFVAVKPSPLVLSDRNSLILWAGFAIAMTAINLRTAVTGFTPLLETIGEDLGYGVGLAGLLGTVPAATFAVFGFIAPVVTRRFGLERTAAFALGLTAAALVLRAYSLSPLILVLSTVLALAGIGAANVVLVPLVKAWFPHRIALWTSLYLILMQTGQFLAPLAAVPLATAGTWRLSVGVWAGPMALTTLVWLVVTLRLPANHHAPVVTPPAVPRLKISRSVTVWGMVGFFAVTSLSNYAIITWVPTMLTDAGATARTGGTMVALYSSWGVVAALLVPYLATRMKRPFVMVAVFAVFMIAGYMGLLFSPLTGTVLWMCALGVGMATFPLCMTLINLRTRSSQTASATSGYVQGIGYALASMGPIGLGLIYQATGTWTVPLIVLSAAMVPGVIAGYFACRPQFVEDSAPAHRDAQVTPRR